MRNLCIRCIATFRTQIYIAIFAVALFPSDASGQGLPKATKFVLPRVPPKSPADALASFEVADGFRIELVAAEPLVMDPVAMAFDERGRLYVVEMRDYSEQDKERLGRLRLLTDDDGDGRFDTSSVFVEDLSWPTAVACYDGGVFVGCAPDILYCKDTTGDGVADERRVVFTGFGRGNVQGLLNSFQWGLDQRIHGSTSSAGGQITRHVAESLRDSNSAVSERLPHVELSGRDFALDPKSLDMVPTTGGAQHGLTFNRWGDRFVCSNSDHLQAVVFEERYLARNPFQSASSPRRSIAADGPQAAVFRISPVEEWRIARTKLRVAGVVPGPIEGGGRPAGYFTSATGVTVYGGGLWGMAEVSGVGGQVSEKGSSASSRVPSGWLYAPSSEWVYVADVGSNLIHRKRLARDGVTYRGQRVDKDTEFVRSRDIWFRPVQMANGPEGALYVADMYREVIEHPASLPPELKSQLDLTSGNDRGRIYRIVPADYKQSMPPSLDDASTGDLVAALDDANTWRRTTAARLLYERHDPGAAALIRIQLTAAMRPEGRITALYALKNLQALSVDDVTAALTDPHPQVRRHALRLSEPLLNTSAALRNKMMPLTADADPIVQFQLALTLGECDDAYAEPALAAVLIRNIENSDIVDAALTSLYAKAGTVLKRLLTDSEFCAKPESRRVLAAIVGQIVRQQRQADVDVLLAELSATEEQANTAGRAAILLELTRLVPKVLREEHSSALAELERRRQSAATQLVRDAQHVLETENVPLEQRLPAIEQLQLDTFANKRELLANLLSPQEPAAVHSAVLATCAEYDAPEVAELVLSHWDQFAPSERSQATELLLQREAWALDLLRQLKAANVSLTTLDPSHVARLENYPTDEVRKLAQSLRGEGVSSDRRQVFASYRGSLAADGDTANGKLVFQKNCATCHVLEPAGEAVGPNLVSMVSRGPESLLFNVLVPNGEVDPRYLEYVVITVDGQVLTGIIAAQTSTAVTIRGADNKTTTVLRIDIEELRNTGRSLMPEGFEKIIDQRAMADLLSYLKDAAAPGDSSQ